MGIAEDMGTFYNNLKIPTDTISSISVRYKRITRQLNRDLWNSESDTLNSMYTGSYGRDTASHGISDLDITFRLPVRLYDQYRVYMGNGQSALLQAVKTSLQKMYPTSNVAGDGQVVVITFNDGIRFEILPVFDHKDGSSFIFPDSNNGGSWQVCNPKAEIKAIQDRHENTNKNLKKICRMLRIWKMHCSVTMTGMLIDTLVYQFIENYEHRGKSFLYYDYIFRDLFDFMSKQDQTQNHWRAPGSGSYVYRTGIFENKARSAHLRVVEANAFGANGNQWSQRQKWRDVFGTDYPG